MRLDELFNIKNGLPSSKVEVHQVKFENSVAYIRPSSTQRRVLAGYIDKASINPGDIYPAKTIFVSTDGQGSHSYTYLSDFEFVPNSNVAILLPKVNMSDEVKLFYTLCVTNNRYKFNYGRKPKGDRLAKIDIPSLEELPKWLGSEKVYKMKDIQSSAVNQTVPDLWSRKWKPFRYDELFEIKRGIGKPINCFGQGGKTPLISASTQNNGLVAYVEDSPIFPGNSISVANSGQGSVGFACYQAEAFIATQNVSILLPKFKMNIFNAMFIVTTLNKERIKWSYGRVMSTDRMMNSTVKLPVDSHGNIDYDFMESYIKKLKFSINL